VGAALSPLQGVVAVSKTVVAVALLSVPLNLSPLVLGLFVFSVYNANKLTDLEEDSVNRPGEAQVVRSHWRLFVGLAVGTYLLAAALSVWRGGVAGAVLAAVPAVSGVAYSSVSGDDDPFVRLKDVYLVNTVLVAGCWALGLTFLPMAFGTAVALSTTAFVFAFVFVRTVISVEVFNVRDVEGDQREGVSTLPVVVGIDRTRQILGVLDVMSLGVLGAGMALGALPATVGIALVPVIGYSMLLTGRLDDAKHIETLCSFKDLEYVLMALIVLPLV
jgi:4-hydroxybenzoate polyprenyltransferase